VAFFSGATAFTFYLGTWQYQRYYWKIDLLAERRLRLEGSPMPFTTLAELSEVSEDAVQRVVCRGTYDFSRQMICGPRPAPRGIKTSSAIRATGFNVVTPLVSFVSFGVFACLHVDACIC
jgi:cytochrome oxidase assembly protein ShyY1